MIVDQPAARNDDLDPGGEVTEIHSWRNLLTGRRFGFKFQ